MYIFSKTSLFLAKQQINIKQNEKKDSSSSLYCPRPRINQSCLKEMFNMKPLQSFPVLSYISPTQQHFIVEAELWKLIYFSENSG